jgi:hypothetical protein
MTAWRRDDIERIGAADEIDVAPLRGDGTVCPFAI